ncbi:MAG: YciI family protein [Nitrospirales bacterium]
MEEKKWDTLSISEGDNLIKETMVYCEELRQNGQLLFANPLEPVEMAMTVRVRNGGVSLTDGPFAETKEQIGGFFLIEARDINQAVQIASKFPSVRLGSMEVRPVRDLLQQGIEAESCQNA